MKNFRYSTLIGDISAIKDADNNQVKNVEDEIQNGVVDNSSELVTFKVEQKICNIESSNQLNIGGFLNANSKFKKFQTKYLATILSNKRKDLTDSNGKLLATKRYGIGVGLVLDVKDIETKVNGNYGVLAASAKLDFSKIGYKLQVFGIEEPSLIAKLPDTSGEFSNDAFAKLSDFIVTAKSTIKSSNHTKLYPIEVIAEEELKLEKTDVKSIYFGVKKAKEGLSLNDAILTLRKIDSQLKENVVQYIYRYFGLKDAYAKPTETQRQNASKWLNAEYNKIDKVDRNGSWVNIDSSFTGNIGNTDINYKPHKKPLDWSEAGKELKDEYSITSADFSSDLKIAAVAEIDTNFNSVVLTRDIAWFLDTNENCPENSQVIETRYGVGIRLLIKLSNVEFGTDVNFGAVGAISELNLANVEYSISGIGFADKALLELLPGPQDINQDTIDQLNKSLNKIKTHLSEMDVNSLNPQPYKIRVMESEKVDPTIEAQAFVLSARQIRDRMKLNETINKANKSGINEKLIKDSYKELGVNDNSRITNQQRNEAIDWLSNY